MTISRSGRHRLASGERSRITFVVLVLIAMLFTETGIAQTDVSFLKKHEGDYVGVPSPAGQRPVAQPSATIEAQCRPVMRSGIGLLG